MISSFDLVLKSMCIKSGGDLSAGMEEVPVFVPRRQQLHRNPQRAECADSRGRA